MKKIFTLVAAAVCAASMNAQTESYISAPEGNLATEFASVVDENGVATNVGTTGRSVVNIATEHMTVEAVGSATPTEVVPGAIVDAEKHWYEAAEIVMGDITWKNANNKLDINDAAGTKLYFVAGQGNAYADIYAEEVYTDGEPTGVYRPAYTYIDYEGGETGLPKYGLYYKFTPSVSGSLKVQVWVNKGNRKTVIVKESTGAPMKYGVDYQAEGYVNGQRANYDTPVIDPETGEPKVDNQGNVIYEQYQIFFTAEEMLERHNNACLDENGVDTKPFVIDAGNQAFWGWLTFDVEAGESYYVFQLSSQLGFGGYEFNFADGISELSTTSTTVPAVRYNLAGQRVDSQYKGVVVENGKKYIVK